MSARRSAKITSGEDVSEQHGLLDADRLRYPERERLRGWHFHRLRLASREGGTGPEGRSLSVSTHDRVPRQTRDATTAADHARDEYSIARS
jgi:hypothetical protein